MATLDIVPKSDPNRLGLLYRHEATRLPWSGPILDVHTHLVDPVGAQVYFEVADWFGVRKAWTMSPWKHAEALAAQCGDRLEFIAVPDYTAGRNGDGEAFTTGFLRDIERFASLGCRVCKFWAAPRGRDVHPALALDHPIRFEAMELARSLGMLFMTHVADPDTWFATHYADHHRYGTKRQQYEPLERMLDRYPDTPCIGAHMGGHPEDLAFLQGMLDRHPNYYLDTSATKWMVRELSKHPDALRAFVERNPGRVLFGTDIVANEANASHELYASRFWALRALLETRYVGPSPIVDPDLSLVDPSRPRESTAELRGAAIGPQALGPLYHDALTDLLPPR